MERDWQTLREAIHKFTWFLYGKQIYDQSGGKENYLRKDFTALGGKSQVP